MKKQPPQLKGLDFTRDQIEKTLQNNGLLRCSIELTKACNLKCPFCFAGAGFKLSEEITYEQVINLIDQAKQLGARTITLLGGEPMIYPKIREVVHYVYQLGLIPLIFTNGTIMNKKLAKFLFKNSATLIVKYNSIDDPSVQDEMVGNVPGAFGKIKQTLNLLIEIGFNKNTPTQLAIETVIGRNNFNQIPKIFRFARQNNIYPYIELITPSGRGKDFAEILNPEKAKKIFYKLLKIDQKEFGYTWEPRPPQVASSCKYYFTSIYVDALGKVQPCPGVPIELGNIKKELLRQILDKPAAIRTRAIRDNIKGKCKTCHLHDFCYGCRGAAFNITGDIYEADPICWIKK